MSRRQIFFFVVMGLGVEGLDFFRSFVFAKLLGKPDCPTHNCWAYSNLIDLHYRLVNGEW